MVERWRDTMEQNVGKRKEVVSKIHGCSKYCWYCFSVPKSCPMFVTPRTVACQASLSFTTSPSLLRFMSIESVMPTNHLILCHPLLLLPSILPSIKVFSNESVLHIRWPKYCTMLLLLLSRFSRVRLCATP